MKSQKWRVGKKKCRMSFVGTTKKRFRRMSLLGIEEQGYIIVFARVVVLVKLESVLTCHKLP